jgi:hypothetical protein
MQAAGGGGGWEFIGYDSFSGSGTSQFTHSFVSGELYMLAFQFRFGQAGGFNVTMDNVTSGNDYDWGFIGQSTTNASTVNNLVGTDAGFGNSFNFGTPLGFNANNDSIGACMMVRIDGNGAYINGHLSSYQVGTLRISQMGFSGFYNGSSAIGSLEFNRSSSATGVVSLSRAASS